MNATPPPAPILPPFSGQSLPISVASLLLQLVIPCWIKGCFRNYTSSNSVTTGSPVYGESNVQDGIARQNEFENTISISSLLLLCQTTGIVGNQAVFNNMSGLGRREGGGREGERREERGIEVGEREGRRRGRKRGEGWMH